MIKSLEILEVGGCYFPDILFRRGGGFRMKYFPAQVALIECEKSGWVLFDTGYSEWFRKACASFPNKLYQLTTPIKLQPEQHLIKQLSKRGIKPEEVSKIFISHFHADHIAGLKDFPCAQYIFQEKALTSLTALTKWKQVNNGFLAELLPADLLQRSVFLEGENITSGPVDCAELEGAQWLDLPGHAPGQAGLILRVQHLEILLAADACWSLDELNGNIQIRSMPKRILWDKTAYLATQNNISRWLEAKPNRSVIACHESCPLSKFPTN